MPTGSAWYSRFARVAGRGAAEPRASGASALRLQVVSGGEVGC